jgi:hypothetical protein
VLDRVGRVAGSDAMTSRGSDLTVVLDAASLSVGAQWGWVQQHLADTMGVVTYDRPGHGWSERPLGRARQSLPTRRLQTIKDPHPKFHPHRLRFHIKPYPKSRHARRMRLSAALTSALVEHQRSLGLTRDDLLFGAPGTRPDLHGPSCA